MVEFILYILEMDTTQTQTQTWFTGDGLQNPGGQTIQSDAQTQWAGTPIGGGSTPVADDQQNVQPVAPQVQQVVAQAPVQPVQSVQPQPVMQQPIPQGGVQPVQQGVPQVQTQPVVSAPVQDIHNDNPVANTQIPSETDIVAPLPGFFGGLFWGVKDVFSKGVGIVSDMAGKTVQTGMNVIWWAAKTAVGTGSSLVSWVTGAVTNNQGGNFLENAVGMVKDVATATVQTGTQAVSGAVDLWKTTVSGAVDMGKDVAWTAVSIVPGELWGNIIQWAVNTVGNVADKAVNVVSSTADTAVNMGTWAVNTVATVGASTVDTVGNIGSSVSNGFSNGEWFGSIAGNIGANVIWTVTNAAGTVTDFGSSAINTITDSVQWSGTNDLPEGTIQTPSY